MTRNSLKLAAWPVATAVVVGTAFFLWLRRPGAEDPPPPSGSTPTTTLEPEQTPPPPPPPPPEPDCEFPPGAWGQWNKGVAGDFRLPREGLRGAKLRPLYAVSADELPPEVARDANELENVVRSRERLQRALDFMRCTEPEMVCRFEEGWRRGWFKVVELHGGDSSLRGRVDIGGKPTFGIRLRARPARAERLLESVRDDAAASKWRTSWDLSSSWVHEMTHFQLYGELGLEQLVRWKEGDAELLKRLKRLRERDPSLPIVTYVKLREHREVFEACLIVLRRRAEYALEHGEELLPRTIWTDLLEHYRFLSELARIRPLDFPEDAEWLR